ncbi:MAG: T9SS type A sorting domain-containing protein [Bacteroidetes bacterium]|nr:T9SS type A sorting domain-containing protein [Bacteroidota bacterium]
MKVNYYPIWAFALALFLPAGLSAQFSFTNSNNQLNNADFHSGVAIGVTDMNEDGYDDIVHMDDGNELYIEFQQANGSFQTLYVGSVSNQSEWSMCVADVDNNGYCDVITGGSYDNVKVAMANDDGTAWEISQLPGANLFLQGSNLADINNDGWLDVFACHDDAESVIWGNDGAGNMILANDWIDMATNPASDNSGNYGSIWTDFDNDGDLDLYIAKCRQGVSDPTDPRRINALYVNDGEGNYSELSEQYGLKIGAQSWTADFNDIDNDGDLDCFITNHDQPSMLLENDGNGYFTDITAGAGINISGTPIQGVLRDFDNDGFVDILVAGGDENIFHNNGDKTFTKVNDVFDNEDMESYAIGDLNRDGFLDIYGGYANIYTNPTNVDDVLWLNEGNDNHFLSVQLRGTESNRSAVGARITIEGDFGIMVREVRAGESYGIMNSMILHFGLGTHTSIDKMTIKWPSGTVNILEDLDVDEFMIIDEEGCDAPDIDISAVGPTVICSGESVTISAPAGYTYEWSNGETSQSITVTEAGNYYVLASEDGSCFGQSNSIEVIVDPVEIPSITVDGDLKFCQGGSVMLIASDALSYEWSNGEETQAIEVTESGIYSVTAEGICDDFESTTIEVEVYNAVPPTGDDQTITEETSVTLTVTGENPGWYDAEMGGNLLYTGTDYTTPVLNATTTYWVEDAANFDGGLFEVGQPTHPGGNQYNGDTFNGEQYFDVLESGTLVAVNVITDTPGLREFQLRDSDGNVLDSKQEDLGIGQTTVVLDFVLAPGTDYALTTNSDINQTTLGTTSPRLMRSSNMVNYPYTVEDFISLTGSNGGPGYFYYFYNWQVEKDGFECISDRTPITVTYSPVDGVNDLNINLQSMQVYPNPSDQDLIQVQMDQQLLDEGLITLIANDGRVILTQNIAKGQDAFELQIPEIPAGFYTLQLISGNQKFLTKLVRM